MSETRVREHLKRWNAQDRILEFDESSATVELAAKAVGCEPARIAKSISLSAGERTILVVTAGDAKIDNTKYKNYFHTKASMLKREEVTERIGHAVGGVCPFGVNPEVEIYLDVSMKRFAYVYPAAGRSNNAIRVTLEELEEYSGASTWVDVCKGWQEEA